jgi:hypothetical protein
LTKPTPKKQPCRNSAQEKTPQNLKLFPTGSLKVILKNFRQNSNPKMNMSAKNVNPKRVTRWNLDYAIERVR